VPETIDYPALLATFLIFRIIIFTTFYHDVPLVSRRHRNQLLSSRTRPSSRSSRSRCNISRCLSENLLRTDL
jgi:hypothetical protein